METGRDMELLCDIEVHLKTLSHICTTAVILSSFPILVMMEA